MPDPIYIMQPGPVQHQNIAPELVFQSKPNPNNFRSTNQNGSFPHILNTTDPPPEQALLPSQFTLTDINFTSSLIDRFANPSDRSSVSSAQAHRSSPTMDGAAPDFKDYQISNSERYANHKLPETPSPSPPSSANGDEQVRPISRSHSFNSGFHRSTPREIPISSSTHTSALSHPYPETQDSQLDGQSHYREPFFARSVPRELTPNHRHDQLLAFPQPPNTPPRTPVNAKTPNTFKPSSSSFFHSRSSSIDNRDQCASRAPPGLSMQKITLRSQNRETHGRPDDTRKLVKPQANTKTAGGDSLSNWAPAPVPPLSAPPPSAKHLPDWAELEEEPGMQTSLPISQISRDLDYSMRRLLNESVFEELLDDALGRHRFRAWLVKNETSESVAKLDMWLDTRSYGRIINAVKKGSMGIHDLYLTPGSTGTVTLPAEQNSQLFAALRQVVSLNVSFDSTQRHLLNSLYHHEFQRFIKQQIVSQAQVRLGKFNLRDEDRNGLGDCFCLTNPRMRDHPIVLVSEGFTRVTGYDRSEIVGRNCRLLQGPGTAPQSVQRIRDGLNYGEGCTELLLNYRRDGSPFYCLLCIMPLRDASGSLVYFIGGQVNVTGLLTGKKALSFLIADSSDGVNIGNPSAEEFGNGKYALSPSMQTFTRTEESGDGVTIHGGSVSSASIKNLNPQAAGYYQAPENAELASAPTSRRLGFFRRKTTERETADTIQLGSQQLMGAESQLTGSRSLDDQLKLFEATYSKLVVFKRETREIIFATRSLLLFLGLPCGNPKETYKSSLIHCDFADLLWSMTPTNKESNNNLRQRVKKVVRLGMVVSQECQVKAVERSFFFSTGDRLSKLKPTRVHLTPMVGPDGLTVAYVCVFG
ncbi:hypothetical protein CROQUDRAFT_652713 [Cronartium quercuum f. sp. fusiforme G11]|uniref:LOV domain-containing protein n=1 Tax=Cronartium quercuum f. sp. fusiforme G11 TaxID=708437 RepID=A0A9P6NTF1_9BASI|nr:hypothetical protein CROQUDRAFT_652713 [Cronartium quercuum f. sp. fusiforme G11]